ncbi:MAG: hypothetical protein KDB98_09600 [Flavobacteriales bacterium]|nr:hypothetical protein [Flavobacteriales bacterium]
MAELSEAQIELVSAYIKQNGVAQDELHDDLLDHVCTSMELRIQQGESFDEAFQYTIKLFGPGGLKQVQNETFELLTEMNETMKKLTFGFGLTSTFLLLAGTIFKVMHWPMASILITLGTALLVLGYLPMILAHKLKESPRDEALLHITGFLGLTLTSVGVLFKVMHWPGAAVTLLGGMAILAFGYVPIYFYKRYKVSANRSVTLSSSIVATACLILIFALMKTGNSSWYEHGVMLTDETLKEELHRMSDSNDELYASLNSGDLSELRSEANQLVTHIDALKLELLAWAANVSPTEAANINLEDLEKKHDLAVVHDLLLGADDKLREGQFSAIELKGLLDHYRNTVLGEYPSELRSAMNSSLALRTDGTFRNAHGQEQDWIHHQFEYTPLFTAITNLTKWQLDIRQMENQVLLSKISRPEASNPPS